MAYRPWGLLDWALSLSANKHWVHVGVLGTEQRSLAAWKWLKGLNAENGHLFLEIRDNPSSYTNLSESLLSERRNEFRLAGGNESLVLKFDLLAELFAIDQLALNIESTARSVILDITSMPKRFFFPLLRAFCRCQTISDLIVTYTQPEAYERKEPLNRNSLPWSPLPGFPPGEATDELLIASLGFAVEGLLEHSETITKSPAIKVLIPFPAPLAALRLSWESMWRLESQDRREKFENHRVSATDVSGHPK